MEPPEDTGIGRVGGEAEHERASLLRKQVKVWTGQLVDLSGRNNLLYYRDLKRGTLDLSEAVSEQVEDVLAGKVVSLSRLFSNEELRADAARRARTVRNKAEEHFEERGLQTLYIACGMATWTNERGGATPQAPVLLCPARLTPRGASQDEFDLSLVGELEVNPTLLHLLTSDFECKLDLDELSGQVDIEGAIDTSEELTAVNDWLADRAAGVPGFSISPRIVLGTFSYAKLPMVNDLEASLDAMIGHELIAAIAGDKAAQAALRERQAKVDATDPNFVPLADEFLVLDADASQNYVINAVLAGQDLIVRGPPGTGKSQTIANLIATLLARRKKVLFVAEKRAAIDAVLKRLEQRGLDDLVLDLHGGTGSRRKLAQGLARTLDGNRSIPRPNHEANQRLVESRRERLNGYAQAIHAVREPWGISAYGARTAVMGIEPTAHTTVRFRGEPLKRLDAESYRTAREDLRSYVAKGGLTLRRSGRPWSESTIQSSEQASAAWGLVGRLAQETLPNALRTLSAAAMQSGAKQPETVVGWGEQVTLWHEIAREGEVFNQGIYEENLDELVAALMPLAEGAARRATKTIASGDFRRARKVLRGHVRDGMKFSPTELYQHVTAVKVIREAWGEVGQQPGLPRIPDDLAAAAAQCEQLQAEVSQLGHWLDRTDLLDQSFDDLRDLLSSLLSDQGTLTTLPDLHQLRSALSDRQLDDFLSELDDRQVGVDLALQMFAYAWLMSVLEAIALADPRVGAFNGDEHRRSVEEFRIGDAEHIETTAERVRRLCAEEAVRVQDECKEEAQLIQYQAGLKRRHLPIRQLFSIAPKVLTALKPCWAMSPLVVSQLLPSDEQYFDVVIFDEASQIRPADAVPAMLRGKRVVVAGDDRQLPPTSFFAAADDAAQDATVGDMTVGADFESILDALGGFLRARTLQWHYRSRDERLIAFSNVYLYDRQLTTFPGVSGDECLRHYVVPFQGGEIGSEESASAEVEQVIRLILEHAVERPEESLGVIAMGVKHADRIDEGLRRELASRPELEAFFDEGQEEKFFVKNLERVQGDERDAIILSIGYGKNADGRLLYRFGPLNQQGGERRLNVAVTRAKNRLMLVSSFDASDMDPERSSAEGVKLLRLYLQYAASRGTNLGNAALDKPALNPFEVDVRDSLQAAGIGVVAQYGCSGYFIDYVAKHPTKPGRMVLAIECDGASYHSSPTARDRDRLRQDHLERLGWQFHRIWSGDWFRDKEAEIERTVVAYEKAVERADGPLRALDRDGLQHTPNGGSAAPPRTLRPSVPYGLKINEYSHAQLCAIVAWVQSDTLLRTEDQLLTETMRELGFQKRGKRIAEALASAIKAQRTVGEPTYRA
jgi:very-short-patch-repair endonuclease